MQVIHFEYYSQFIEMQQSGGLLLARARPSKTIIFAAGKNASRFTSAHECQKATPNGVAFEFRILLYDAVCAFLCV